MNKLFNAVVSTNNEQYSTENKQIEEINSKTYDFNGHKLKLLKPIAVNHICKICNQDTITSNKDLILLPCRHINHNSCSSGMFSVYDCTVCEKMNLHVNVKVYNIYEILDNLKLNCINENCSLSVKYKIIKKYNSETLKTICNETLNNSIAKFEEELLCTLTKKIDDEGLLPFVKKSTIITMVKPLIVCSIQELKKTDINIDTIKEKITDIIEICPYPHKKFSTEAAQGFLSRNQVFILDFMYDYLIQQDYIHAYDQNPKIEYTNEGILVDVSKAVNIGYKVKSLLYKTEMIEIGETGADVFKKLQFCFTADLAILDLIYRFHSLYFSDDSKTHFCLGWSSAEDYIIIKNSVKSEKIKLSAFINPTTKNIDFDALQQEVEKYNFNYQELKSYK